MGPTNGNERTKEWMNECGKAFRIQFSALLLSVFYIFFLHEIKSYWQWYIAFCIWFIHLFDSFHWFAQSSTFKSQLMDVVLVWKLFIFNSLHTLNKLQTSLQKLFTFGRIVSSLYVYQLVKWIWYWKSERSVNGCHSNAFFCAMKLKERAFFSDWFCCCCCYLFKWAT